MLKQILKCNDILFKATDKDVSLEDTCPEGEKERFITLFKPKENS